MREGPKESDQSDQSDRSDLSDRLDGVSWDAGRNDLRCTLR
jgi:hypothetical protein